MSGARVQAIRERIAAERRDIAAATRPLRQPWAVVEGAWRRADALQEPPLPLRVSTRVLGAMGAGRLARALRWAWALWWIARAVGDARQLAPPAVPPDPHGRL